jgi:flavin reductase (DIM6/NTAB) family NADH-FMN oxidoreductase RutF
VNRDAFDRLVALMDPAMVVVTVAAGEERDGCLVGFHSQSSIEPPRYAVWLSIANRTQELAQRATHLAVHVLGDHDHHLAELFGGETGDEVDKLARCEWTPGPDGVPLLLDTGHFVGRIVERFAADGDHALVVLEPVEAEVDDAAAPLRLAQASDIEPGHAADDRR